MSKKEKPCGFIHPLPCGLDVDCEVPVEYHDALKTSEEIWEDFITDNT